MVLPDGVTKLSELSGLWTGANGYSATLTAMAHMDIILGNWGLNTLYAGR